ncbi:MAG: YadA-like family protein [Veillonella sp.]|uniref:YadA-like family protein n=1 Tax=Veillonella atypica TaxID=39777 RepID=UPI001CB0C1C3|nr:YadA-like family protein [Veillonella sp.]MBF1755640.1 YadA-like family protein [Veillonella sp.]MDU2972137.1 YadA-like family protein [Veillonella sp.]
MNYATKLCIVSMVSVFSVSSMGLVQAADTPIVSTGGAAYNIGLQGASFTNSDNVSLGGQAGATNSNPYSHSGDPNATGNNIAIGRVALNGSQGGGNVALGSKTFIEGKGDYNFLGNFAAGFKSTISDTIAIGAFAGSGATGNKNVWLGAGQAGGSTGNNTVLIGSNSTVDGNFNYGIGHNAELKGESNAVVGAYNHVTANNTYVLGDHVTTTLDNAVVLGSHSTAESTDVVSTPSYTYAGGTVNFAGTAPVSTVSIGTTGQERTITHVAAGRVSADSTDAINGSQLYGANQQIDNLYNKISNIGKDANKGDARAAALAALHPMQFDPDNRVQVMGGIGHYKDANALALGVGYYPKENLLLTAGATVSDRIMANLGVSYKFGENKTLQKISPASYNALEQRVDTLEAQNKKLQETVDMLVQKLNNR